MIIMIAMVKDLESNLTNNEPVILEKKAVPEDSLFTMVYWSYFPDFVVSRY